jgi:microtubule-associated protein, RP/EB family
MRFHLLVFAGTFVGRSLSTILWHLSTGMMDAAYFTGRKELLDFFNDLLDLNLTKIEQTATGAIACQMADLIFPGSIPMSKVNWAARSDYEFVQNYKLLQNAFTKNRVQRHVDVDKLIRAKYQDNLEFCQWLKAFFDQSGRHREDYDPSAVRARGKGGALYNKEMGKGVGVGAARPRPTAAAPKTAKTAAPKAAKTTTASAATNKASADRFSRPLRERASNPVVAPESLAKEDYIGAAVAADAELMLQNKELLSKIEDLELAVLETEKERNFYFEKLRNVEIMLQVHQEKGKASDPDHLVTNVFKMLYATAEDRLTVNEDGEVVGEDELIDTLADSV